MEAQRNRSRKSARFYEDEGGEWQILHEGGGQGFASYNISEFEVEVMRYRQDGSRVELIFNQTPFYAESGGEVADRGEILIFNASHEVLHKLELKDVQKLNGIIHHIASCDESIQIDHTVVCKAYVDIEYRARKKVHHTGTHLLHAALKTILGSHVEQKGNGLNK